MAFETDPGWQFLRLSPDKALEQQSKIKYDPKTTIWIPDAEEGFVRGEIEKTEENKITVRTESGNEVTLKKDDTQEVNPPKFEKAEDMSDLTFLNEASVLHNLRQRYYAMLIYTYSGLFCVVINPYKRLPIYSDSIIQMFMSRRRTEMPPHLFAVSDEAYRNMLYDGENQSMLITGESGAGKTENTKKVIAYFAHVGATSTKDQKEGGIEDQIVKTNPVLEAYGNAKTVRNNNSSRFGKFIRVHFNSKGKLAGADIAHYLLEKSRVIRQAPGERCYHIFYQLMSGKINGIKEKLLLDSDIKKYHFVSQAELTIPGIDDAEEMGLTEEAFDIMGFTQREKDELYKLCAIVMHQGEMKFKQRPREEQAETEGTDEAEKFCKLAGVDFEKFLDALLKPTVKVGHEWVNKGQNLDQVTWTVGALAKALYARGFTWIIQRCNKTLEYPGMERKHFIGVLDIAGFEIFDLNSFEQLWINFVNEKLQQFFNHHMFVLEQEEYQREGIQWEFIDFGLDLQTCIELIEKPLGLISMLDEECIVPKATDLTLASKLDDQHLGKHPNFQKPKPPKGKQSDAHFAVVHYAGTVRYNVKGFLEKNKDPLNDSAVAILKGSEDNQLLREMWQDYITQEEAADLAKRGKEKEGGKKKKGGSMMTVSMMYRESLNNLMSMLHTTHPHFIRCIIPNEMKQAGVIDAPLVLNQLTCNGVLEGIRICRKGFPNRMLYPDFKHRYAILAPDEAGKGDPKPCSEKMLARLNKEKKIVDNDYRVGSTKVFFRAGVLAHFEEMRDEALGKIITKFQCACRHYLAQCDYKRRLDQINAYIIIQSNIRAWCTLRTWPWFRLYAIIKPLLVGQKTQEEMEKMEAKVTELETFLETEKSFRLKAEEESRKLQMENENLAKNLEKETDARNAAEKQAAELNNEVLKLEDANAVFERTKKSLEAKMTELASMNMGLQSAVQSLEKEKEQRFKEITALQQEMVEQDKLISKLTHDRKVQEEVNRQLSDNLDAELIKNERLEAARLKLQDQISELEKLLEHEKKLRQESDKTRKKLDVDCRSLTDQLEQARLFNNDVTSNLKRKEAELIAVRTRMDEDDGMICKLQFNLKELMKRIEQLEEESESERRGRTRAEKLRVELQEELDMVNQRVEESSGALSAQLHINKQNKEEVGRLSQEMDERNFFHESQLSEMANGQWSTLNHLRDLSFKAASLESEAQHVLHSLYITPSQSTVTRVHSDIFEPRLHTDLDSL